jgi:rifampicin phosphotransferase
MSPTAIHLFEAHRFSLALTGHKARNLGLLAAAGFRVPEGVVVAPASRVDDPYLLESISRLGAGLFAVRSSAPHEDTSGSSRAGHYRSLLAVARADVPAAIQECRFDPGLREIAGVERQPHGIPVIVQRMVDPRAAGVAFTADPSTGDRNATVVTATGGLADRLVSGRVSGDEWVVSGRNVSVRRRPEAALTARQVRQIARVGQRIAEQLGSPQDIEWAIDGAGLWILQARPITALPPDVDWETEHPGVFHRSFRFGEWISEPVTPLFEDWLLSTMERRLHAIHRELIGQMAPEPFHVVVNGWYFYSLNFLPVPGAALRSSFRHIVRTAVEAPQRVAVMLPLTAHHGYPLYEAEWRTDLEPRYRNATEHAERRIDRATPGEVVRLVDGLAALSGEYFASISVVAGSAYKIESGLARFWNRHLRPVLGGSHMELLGGLHDAREVFDGPLLETLDWHTALSDQSEELDRTDRERLTERRTATEAAARKVLARKPRRLQRFDTLLAHAQHLEPVREEQVAGLSRPWPAMRRGVLRLGEHLVEAGAISAPEDVFFLTRTELVESLESATPRQEAVDARRAARQTARRLTPPMHVGRMPLMVKLTFTSTRSALGAVRSDDALVTGVPASPGRATGPVRVVRDSSGFGAVAPGDVVVAPLTSPAWVPLFSRAAGLVTDIGSGLAHASIIAREFGIPAVVGCGDATTRLRTGMQVTVDGTHGTVMPAAAANKPAGRRG